MHLVLSHKAQRIRHHKLLDSVPFCHLVTNLATGAGRSRAGTMQIHRSSNEFGSRSDLRSATVEMGVAGSAKVLGLKLDNNQIVKLPR